MEDLGTFLANMPFWGWMILAVLLLILEILTGTTYMLWPAAAAFILGLVTTIAFQGQWEIQLALFAGLTFILTVIGTPYARKWLLDNRSDKQNLNERGAQKIGQHVEVVKAFHNGKGKVKVGDTEWNAQGDQDFEEGVNVEIVSVDGITLIVKSL
ncbi:MAG: NfeD family protein [bacterium]